MKFKITTRVPVSLLLAFCILMMPIVAIAKKGDKNFKQGMRYEQAQQWEKAAQEFTLALAADPSNVDYQLHFRRASFNASQSFMQQGRALAEQRDFVGAYNAFRQAYGYDSVNELAVSEMERMLHLQRVKEGMSNGSTPAKTGEPQQGTLGSQNGQAQEATPPPARSPEVLRVVSFSGDLKSYIRTLAEQLNLNVIFDRQSFVQPKTIDINLRDVTTSQALDYIFLQEGLFFQKLSRRTIVVADQTRRPQYQQLVLRTFFLANSEPEKAKILIGQAIPPSVGRPQTIVVADKDTNSLTVRDTAENVRLIGELLQSIDKDRAEVVMDVNIYEVSKSDLMQFGNQFGSDTTLSNLGGLQRGFSLLAGGAPTVGLPVSLGAALIFPSSQIQALQSKNNTKLIASTQVHAFNGEESTARIGQRVPVQTAQAYPFGVQTGTTTNNNTGFPSGGFPVINYEPTGLTLKFTPQVFPNHDVQVKMSIESKDVLGAGTLTPTFTERTITGTARVQNNRTMMLASVSQDVHTTGRRGLPILGLIPVLGRIFTAPTRDDRRIDIVIAVTPRVLRAPAITPRDEEMRPSGTLQSPTTGSLEAMLRESDREDQLAEWRLQQQNAAAARTAAAKANVVPAPATVNPAPMPVQTVSADASLAKDVTKEVAGPATTTVAQQLPPSTSPTQSKVTTQGSAVNPGAEESAFVPAPKSIVSNRAAAEVAAVNTNPNINGEARAVLTSLSEANATPPVSAVVKSSIGRTAQLRLASDESLPELKVGEKRRFAIELKSDVSLAMAVLALRFDPKVIRVNSITPGTLLAKTEGNGALPSLAQSIDPTGVCFISISSLNGAAAIKGTGTLVFIEIEGVGAGDAALAFENGAMHLVATDARDVTLEAVTARATVKQ